MNELWEALKPALGEAAGFFIVCAIIGLLAVLKEAARIVACRGRVSVAVMLDEIAQSDRSPRGVR